MGMTVLITTAYLDEAERCNRVGLMHKGRLVRCNEPQAMRTQLADTWYEVRCPDQRKARTLLQSLPGVLSAEPAGAVLHLFLSSQQTSTDRLQQQLAEHGLGPAVFTSITPSLEDAFIALIRKENRDGVK